MKFLNSKELNFDDVFIVPRFSNIKSRDDVYTGVSDIFHSCSPLVSANMTTVTEWGMARQMAQLGALGVLPYDMRFAKVLEIIRDMPKLVGVAIGLNTSNDMIRRYVEEGAGLIVVDTAHGDTYSMLQKIEAISGYAEGMIVAGNVVTGEATKRLIEAGATVVKTGIGPGQNCLTRLMTGAGRPQFSAILECAEAADQAGGYVWADGGIKNPRDVALAIAAGATRVMIGTLFAATITAPGLTQVTPEGKQFKEHYGMASSEAVAKRGGNSSYVEGISSRVEIHPERQTAEAVHNWLLSGLRSAMSYTGAASISEFQAKALIGIGSTQFNR